ncbi:MAG: GNAT family N-acetyltransferase [Actinomycetota bacterium]|nr:GNAT family N-acetyltransferase [Actinomycetota bacterium]
MTSPTKLPLFPAWTGVGTAAPAAFDVRLVEAHDLALLVEVHLQQFPDGFYARLGPAFMTRYFQQCFRSPAAIGLIAEQCDGSGLVGYLVGTVDNDAHDRFMNGPASPALAAAGASALVRRPSLWSDFARLRALWYARRFVSRAVRPRRPSAEPRHGELLYICTTAGHRRRGVGAALLRSYVEGAKRARAASLHLVSERENASGRDFYEHRGWRVVSESVTRDGRPLVRMGLSLGGFTG